MKIPLHEIYTIWIDAPSGFMRTIEDWKKLGRYVIIVSKPNNNFFKNNFKPFLLLFLKSDADDVCQETIALPKPITQLNI